MNQKEFNKLTEKEKQTEIDRLILSIKTLGGTFTVEEIDRMNEEIGEED